MKTGSETVQEEDTQDLEIKALGTISPKTAEKFPEVTDSVHRTGKRKEGSSARGIIILNHVSLS